MARARHQPLRAERVILPDATILLDYMLVRMTGLVEGLVVRPERMRENIERGPRAPREQSACWCARRAWRAVARGRRTRSSSAPRSGPPTSGARCATCWRSTPTSRSSCRLAELDACFDDAALPAPRARRHRPTRQPGGRSPSARSGSMSLTFLRSGKVRDLYAVGDERLLLVASDRLSAFDVVLPTAIPDKGRVLTGLSRFWFARDGGPRRRTISSASRRRRSRRGAPGDADELRGRMMLCRRASSPAGRGRSSAATSQAPAGRTTAGPGRSAGSRCRRDCARAIDCRSRSSRRRRRPSRATTRTSRSTRRPTSSGGRSRERVAELAIALYRRGAEIAEPAGIILADTKFEFGTDPATGELILIDEVLTPDSSRFWDASDYEPGRAQASFDKQYVRDWLETLGWDKTPPGPELPAEVVAGTRARYVEAFERITGASFERYLEDGRGRRVSCRSWTSASRSTSGRSPGSSIRRAGPSRAAWGISASTA